MSKKRNAYASKARKRSLLGEITTAADTSKKGDVKSSLVQVAKDGVAGVAGGAIGALLGRISLLAGLLVAGIGNYFKNRMATAAGIGMMTSGGVALAQSLSGDEKKKTFMEGAKERLMNFKDIMAKKLFLDKLPFGKKAAPAAIPQTTAGMGEVQYFAPPSENLLGEGAAEMDILRQLEQRITESGRSQAVRGTDDMQGNIGDLDQLTGDLDPTSKNY